MRPVSHPMVISCRCPNHARKEETNIPQLVYLSSVGMGILPEQAFLGGRSLGEALQLPLLGEQDQRFVNEVGN